MRRRTSSRLEAVAKEKSSEAQGVCQHVYAPIEAVVLANVRCPWETIWSTNVSAVQRAAKFHADNSAHEVLISERATFRYGWLDGDTESFQ